MFMLVLSITSSIGSAMTASASMEGSSRLRIDDENTCICMVVSLVVDGSDEWVDDADAGTDNDEDDNCDDADLLLLTAVIF